MKKWDTSHFIIGVAGEWHFSDLSGVANINNNVLLPWSKKELSFTWQRFIVRACHVLTLAFVVST
jgi:hypothetical protein